MEESGFSWLKPLEWLYKFFTRPIPDILFTQAEGFQENDYCHTRLVMPENKRARFYRLGVVNKGRERIAEADIRVEKIYHWNQEEWVDVSTSPFFLRWANEGTDDSRSIYKNTPVFVDLVYAFEGESEFIIYMKSKHTLAGINNKFSKGKYKLVIKLLGQNIEPLPKDVFITFEKNWDSLDILVLNH